MRRTVSANHPRRPTRLALHTFAAFVAVACPAGAQDLGLDPGKRITQYSLDAWTTADGLPQNSVTAVVQTRDGYLWLGTYSGLVRFDGVRFTVFDKVNTPALGHNGIQALLEDREGGLWIGTNGGGLTRYRAGEFSAFTTKNGLAHDIVRTLHQDPAGVLWIGTNDGLSRYESGRFTTLGAKDGLPNAVVRAIVSDRDGRLWVGTNGGGLARLDGSRLVPFGAGLPSPFVFSLATGRDGALWVGTNGGGLAKVHDGTVQKLTTKDGLSGDIIWAIKEDRDGSLWVGTYGGGLSRIRDGRIETFSSQQGLPNDFVRTLWQDREGSLWIGTYSGGLARLRDGKFTTYTRSEGLSHDFARAVLQDSAGAVWIGTTGGGLCRLLDERIRCYGPKEGVGLDVRALLEDHAGTLWVGTGGEGLYRRTGERFERVSVGGNDRLNVSALSEDPSGALWVGTNGQGLYRRQGGKWETHGTGGGLPNDFVMATLVDREGVLWVGTDGGGLSRFDGSRFTTLTRRDGLASDIVLSLQEDSAGVLWAGTSGGGLTRVKDGALKSFGPAEGLFDDVIFRVLEVDGTFWLSGNKGIASVARKELEEVAAGQRARVSCVVYGAGDGMKSSEGSGIAQPAGWRARDGALYFPTARGVARIDPHRIRQNRLVPPVHVESVVVDGRPLDLRAEVVQVEPGRERWEFKFTALSLLAPHKVQFRYRMAGLDLDWIPAGSERAAYYMKIPPGTYTFQVVACNDDGVWSTDGAAVHFRLRPHFHQTAWFPVLVAAVLVLAAAAVYRARVRQLKAREQELEQLVAARTREVEEQRREAEQQKDIALAADALKSELLNIAAHDLKTPLQSIVGFADLMSHDVSGAAQDHAARIHSAADRMLHIVNDVLESAEIEDGRLVLDRQKVDFAALADSVVQSFRPLAARKNQILAYSAPDPCLVEADESRLRQVIENLLSNAVKYSPRGADVTVRVEPSGPNVVLKVQDQGPGLTEQDLGQLFARFKRLAARPTGGEPSTGLGLAIVRQLVDLHGGRAWAESPGRGQGSTFHVELPRAEA